MPSKNRSLYTLSAEQVRGIRDKLKMSRSQAALYLRVGKTTLFHYEKKGVSNGVIAQRLIAIAKRNGIDI